MTSRRALVRVVALGGLSVAFVAVLASPAFAHAVLLQTIPGEGAVLTTPPKMVSLRYNEQVTVNPGAIRVYDAKSNRVDSGTVSANGDTVQVAVRPHLADGAYVVTWRVISADTHPIEGAFTFQVGLAANATAPNVTGLAQNLLHNQKGDQTVGVVYGILRGTLYAGVALLLGAVAFAAFIWPGARGLRRTAHLLWAGWITVAVVTVGEVLIQGVYGAALKFDALFRTDLIRAVLGTQFGHMSMLRLALLVGVVPLLRLLLRDPLEHPLPSWAKPAAVGFGLVLSLTFALSGHAHTGDYTPIAITGDLFHINAMAVWLGGLAVLAYAVFPGRAVEELRDAVPRFSRTAIVCVAALIISGSFQSWRQVRSIHALLTTTYGHTLLVKLTVVAVLVVFGALSRQIVGFLYPTRAPELDELRVPVVAGGADNDQPGAGPPDDPELDDEDQELDEAFEYRRLKRSVIAEVLLGMAVIAVTALLVNAAPAKVAAANRNNNGATGVTLKDPRVWVDITIAPGVAPGANDVHVTAILPSGAPTNLRGLTATIDYPSRQIAPLTIPMRLLGPGHYLSPGFTIPFPGNWRITTHAQTDPFTEITLVGTVPIA
jgi:copper transport protein